MTADRGTWSGKLDFIMSALSFAVGMGNLWRFPYLCYRNGGGVFLIPYIISMFLLGYPLMFLELALGQYGRQGIVSIWKVCPLFEGIGWGMFFVSVFTAIYYVMIVAWCFFYVVASFARDVPWRSCDQDWATENCWTGATQRLARNCTSYNGTWWNDTCVTEDTVGHDMYQNITVMANASLSRRVSPADEFYNNYMLTASEGFHDMGVPQWKLVACLLACWLIVFVVLVKGIRVSGKVTYVTALFPYVVLTILLVRGLTLDGAADGIKYYVTPRWEKLLSPIVWGDAAVQAFFSLSLCWGGLISLASYNRFNNDCLRDTIVVATGDMLTSIFGGFVIFAIIGYMADQLGLPIDEVATQGPGLAFIVYPEAVATLPVSPLWSIFFMTMLINIGIGSQMGLVSTVHTTLLDIFQDKLRQGRKPLFLLAALCLGGFLLGLSLTTRGGIYMLLLMDTYSATYSLMMLALAECIALGWVYGVNNFYDDIEQMIGRQISFWWRICWRFINPVLTTLIMVFIIMDFKRSSYRDYVFPVHWDVMGWGLTVIPTLCIPGVAIIKVMTTHKDHSVFQRIRLLSKPHELWGPGCLPENAKSRKSRQKGLLGSETHKEIFGDVTSAC